MRIANQYLAALALTGACTVFASAAEGQAFPVHFDPAQMTLQLERGQCHGSCPEYRVEIRGDGRVVYEGKISVLVKGTLIWFIPREEVTAIIDVLRESNYFALADEYSDGKYGPPTVVTRITIAKRTKSVSTRGATCKADAPAEKCVPVQVEAMQDEIDRILGMSRLTEGDARTMPFLDRAGFDFSSTAAASAVLFALGNMNAGLARELVARGAPMNGGRLDSVHGEQSIAPAILLVPATADVDLASQMITKGALTDPSSRQLFLVASAASGSASMTKLALEQYPDVRGSPAPYPWVVVAASARMHSDGTHWKELYARPEYALWVRNFDPAAVLRLLVAAGADPKAVGKKGNTALHLVQSGAAAQVLIDAGSDPNAVNHFGRTPLHVVRSDDFARVMIRAGAKVNAQDTEGATPLFDCYDPSTVRVLLQAGADIKHRAPDGTTALFFQSNAETTAVLINAGADVNAQRTGGLSVLESAKSIDSALLILRAGALLPEDPARRKKLATWASDNNAQSLSRELEERAASQER